MFLQEEIDPTFGGRPMQSSDSARGTSRCCVSHGDLGREEPTAQFCHGGLWSVTRITSPIASLLMLTHHVHTIYPLLWAVITG
jgi:hypothetical protein